MGRLKRIRLILGDQLNPAHSWFTQTQDDTIYFMAEMNQEAQHPTQHIQKIVAFFHAMRTFARQLETGGHQVIYQPISAHPEQSLSTRILALIELHHIACFEYQLPDDYRVDKQLR